MKKIGVNKIGNWLISKTDSSISDVITNDVLIAVESGLFDSRDAIIGNIDEAYKMLKENLLEDKSDSFESLCETVYRTVCQYFGDTRNFSERLGYFLLEDDIKENNRSKISDLYHKNAAACVERAVLSHNLLKSLGLDSTMKISTIMKDENKDSHAYNLIKNSEKCYIFDASIPRRENNKITPIICEISEEAYNKISNPDKSIGCAIDVNFESLYNSVHIVYDSSRDERYGIFEKETKIK